MDFELILYIMTVQMRRVVPMNLRVPMVNVFSSVGIAIEMMIVAMAAMN